ncbi:MAG: dipeptidase [Pikeienuella sp.]
MKPIADHEIPAGLPAVIARLAERVSNQTDVRDLQFHPLAEDLFLADLHADTLLWGVDPLASRNGGHLDGPRLRAARLGLQVFAAPTWTPLPFRNDEDRLVVSRTGFDQVDALFPTEILSPARTRSRKRRSRALKIAQRFRSMVKHSERETAPFTAAPVYSAADLDALSAPDLTSLGKPTIGVMLSLEGLHWLTPDDDQARVDAALDELFEAGFRMIAPTHRFSNGLGGASENSGGRGGLTAAGKKVINGCFDRRIVVDLAHAAPALIREACGLALTHDDGPRPVLISHSGVKAVNPSPRNLSVADIRAVVATGGVIGVGFWRSAMGWADDEPFEDKMGRIVESVMAILETISTDDFVDEMMGRFGRFDPYEHIAFGSDFDGATTTAFDVTGVSYVVAALARIRGADLAPVFPREKLALIAGENTRRVLQAAMS